MIEVVNGAVRVLVDMLMMPFACASPWPAAVGVSFVVALMVLAGYKVGADAAAIRRAKGRVVAGVMEIHLFGDDLAGLFSGLGRSLKADLDYLRLSLRPLLILIVPLGLLFVQLYGWFQFRPLQPGETTLLTVRLDAAVPAGETAVSAVGSSGIVVEAPPFVSARRNEIVWRVRVVDAAVPAWVDVTAGGETIRKALVTGLALRAVSTERVRDGAWNRLMHPSEKRLAPGSCTVSVAVAYPRRRFGLGPFDANWVLAVFAMSLVVVLALKRPLRVEL